MARPKSEDKRAALLEAAIRVFAESGLGAPTALISAKAGVSEGSLFTYFGTKDALVNEVYREIRVQVAAAVMTGFPSRAGVRTRLLHIWSRYVMWGAGNPETRKALKLVSMSHVITPEVRAEGAALFGEVDQIERDALAMKKLHRPPEMAGKALKALAEMTMDLIESDPSKAAKYREAGFAMLWGALTAKP